MSYKTIRAKLMEKAVGPVDERLVEYMIRNFDSVTFMSAEKLCYVLECTKEDLQRLYAAFGAKSQLEMMGLLREAVYWQAGDADRAPERELRDIVDMMARYEMANITEFTTNMNVELVDRLARDLSAATEVYIVGVRSSAPMSIYAAHILSAAGIKTRKIDVAENYVDGVVNIDRTGLVLALG